ncbi:MAG: hypothetical protein ACLFTE_10580, partial [Salinivenus sp.]
SFVRAYAAVVGMSPKDAVRGLEAALAGEYQNALAVEYLQEAPMDSGDDAEAEAKSGSEPEDENTEDDLASETSAEAESTARHESPPASARADEATPPRPEEADRSTGTDEPDISDLPPAEPDRPPVVGDEGPSPPTSRSTPSASTWRGRESQGVIRLVAAVLVVLLVAGVGLWMAFGTGAAPEKKASPAAPDTTAREAPDSVSATEPDTSQAPSESTSRSSPAPTPGDTIHLTLRADSTVSGIRLRQDDDLRRPYWIEQGEATTFPFTSRITVENGLDDVTLFLEDRPVQPAPDSAGRIVLDRDRVSALLDTAQGAAPSWSPSPDTISIAAPEDAAQ